MGATWAQQAQRAEGLQLRLRAEAGGVGRGIVYKSIFEQCCSAGGERFSAFVVAKYMTQWRLMRLVSVRSLMPSFP